ncbi:ATP-binding cassette domain-containing protein [Brevibacillus choshinensis]|uniref:ATP-binding cassette domain-containing protein n=1 Tax=Brevibacillus choshinensis TaxID=54911 RepID=UPI002E23A08F|nr:ATP-binding cassette domain-containing protein [Brevibacillus choshinensis]MED4582673.1 ATP-binding cassette domain-containing protein [Brevibacillus choshinensis]
MYAFQINNLSYVYPNGEKALSDISGAIPINSKVVVLGSSGSGKTTLAHQLSGLKFPNAGSVHLFGEEMNTKCKRMLRQRIAFVEQEVKPTLFIRTVWEYVTAGVFRKSLEKVERIRVAETALGIVGMLDSKFRSISYLSAGQKRRMAIARAIATQADILVLDDPISGLDPEGYSNVYAILEGLHLMGKTLIVMTSDVDFASSWSDHVFVLSGGSLLETGSPSLTVNEELMRKARLRLPMVSIPFSSIPELRFHTIPRTVDEARQVLREIVQR